MHTSAAGAVARRLSTLALLYESGQASDLMDRTLGKLLAHEAEKSRSQLAQLQADLADFETRYAMSSQEFYNRYRAGQTDDRMDFVEWAALSQMTSNLEHRLRLLTGEDRA